MSNMLPGSLCALHFNVLRNMCYLNGSLTLSTTMNHVQAHYDFMSHGSI
jgi:hypothetical protein